MVSFCVVCVYIVLAVSTVPARKLVPATPWSLFRCQQSFGLDEQASRSFDVVCASGLPFQPGVFFLQFISQSFGVQCSCSPDADLAEMKRTGPLQGRTAQKLTALAPPRRSG